MAIYGTHSNINPDAFVIENGVLKRKMTVQGPLMKVKSAIKRPHTGGGIRKAQHGHKRAAVVKMTESLFTCEPAKHVAWLTFPYMIEPEDAVQTVQNFIKKLERQCKTSFPSVIKLELQPEGRLCPEITLLIWYKDGFDFKREKIEKEWRKSVKNDNAVTEDRIVNKDIWMELVEYTAKGIEVINDDTIRCGSKYRKFSEEELRTAIDPNSIFIPDSHYPTKIRENFLAWVRKSCDKRNIGFSEDCIQRQHLIYAWKDYDGHFQFRHQRSLIPKYAEHEIGIDAEDCDALRNQIVNPKRKIHFVGKYQGFTLRGHDAEDAGKLIPTLSKLLPPSKSSPRITKTTPPA